MNSENLSMNVVEVIHYFSDYGKSIDFYEKKLGWPLIWKNEGNMATFDAGGVYQLTLVSSKWTTGWEEGKPVPKPQCAFESKNLNEDAKILAELGIEGVEVNGDPATMLFSSLNDPEGNELFMWQDVQDAASKVVEKYKAEKQPEPIYKLGECIFFVQDLANQEKFFIDKLGFQVRERHGDAFTGLERKDGPVLGLYHWPKWWDHPTEPSPDRPVRLFLECPDVDAEFNRQKSSGIDTGELRQSESGLKWFSIADPDGNIMTFWEFKQES